MIAESTPGPWKVIKNRALGSLEVGPTDDYPICEMWRRGHKELEAINAHLISAAPEMYEALKRAISEASHGDETLWARQARAALAKAEGKGE